MIGLTAVVKDETKNLEQFLSCVRPVIGYYCIMDTGSTDGTPEKIKEMMDGWGIEGEIHHCEFDYLGRHRQEILDLAYASGKADYLITSLDADEEFHTKEGFDPESLTYDCYHATKYHGTVAYKIPVLLKADKPRWQWTERVHSFLRVDGVAAYTDDIWIISHPQSGSRSHGLTNEQKFLRDAERLKVELKKNPNHPRNQFYLAQSYRDAGKHGEAYKHYMKRVKMEGGLAEEVYVSLLNGARCNSVDRNIFNWEAEVKAHAFWPTRIEALYDVVRYCRINKFNWFGYAVAKEALKIPYPSDILFVENQLWDWRMKDEFAVCACGTGKYAESAIACQELLGNPRLPEADRKRIEDNLQKLRERMERDLPTFVVDDTLPEEERCKKLLEHVEQGLQSWCNGRIV